MGSKSARTQQIEEQDIETKEINLSDVAELSLTDVLILQLLVRYKIPILRSALKESLDSLFYNQPGVSSSSFYNRMKQLNAKGFLTMEGDKNKEKDPNVRITGTTKAIQAVCLISAITNMATIDWVPFISELIKGFSEHVKLPIDGNVLIINLESAMDVNTINMIGEQAVNPKKGNCYIIANSDDYRSYLARNMSESIQPTEHKDGQIMAPDGWFSAISIVGYECFDSMFNVPIEKWMEEAYRVLEPGGLIVVSSLEDIDDTGHFISDAAISNINESNLVKRVSKSNVEHDLKEARLNNVDTFIYKGFLLSWGYK